MGGPAGAPPPEGKLIPLIDVKLGIPFMLGIILPSVSLLLLNSNHQQKQAKKN
jgi:hypothetical protein